MALNDKLLDKLAKLKNAAEGEAKLGNSAAAEAFAQTFNRLLLEHELSPEVVEAHVSADADPIVEIRVDLDHYGVKRVQRRTAWQEELARIVAAAHLCKFLVAPGTNMIWFVGTRSHATVAEYVFGTLAKAADKLSLSEYYRYESRCRAAGDTSKARGFREAWLTAFVVRIFERLDDVRRQLRERAKHEAGQAECTALIRLDGQLVRVEQYVEDKFKGRKNKNVESLSMGGSHRDGAAWGRKAADAVEFGRGVDSGKAAKRLS